MILTRLQIAYGENEGSRNLELSCYLGGGRLAFHGPERGGNRVWYCYNLFLIDPIMPKDCPAREFARGKDPRRSLHGPLYGVPQLHRSEASKVLRGFEKTDVVNAHD